MNYDDIINDHEERIESLESGGGGSSSASGVSYDDSTTQYGETNVQKVLEKVKALIGGCFSKSGGDVDGNVNVKGQFSLFGALLGYLNADNFIIGNDSKNMQVNVGNGESSALYVVNHNAIRPGGASKEVVTIGQAGYRFKTVYSVDGNFSGDVTASNIGTTLESKLSSAYSLATANTVYSPLSITLPAGTWLMVTQVVSTKPSATRYLAGTVSTTNKDSTHTFTAFGNATIEACASAHNIVTLTSEATYYLSIACNNTGVSLTTSTKMSAIRIK